ncbi:MAG: DUF3021 domain-containing protein [Lachnospiraceae bacterium]|nr:DUF3021 domain-containing protein [Lachnospiraceae bacterium]
MSIKKKIMLRAISGLPIGLSIGYLITIVISLIWADGYYASCVPALAETMGNEINAVILQALLCAILGMGFGGCSVIWEIEDWGIAKQTGIYFLIVSLIMMPIAYVTYWMEHSVWGLVSYFGIFAFIFAIVWAIQYGRAKHNVKKINERMESLR